jgi:Transmembrane amino acid transporter protein
MLGLVPVLALLFVFFHRSDGFVSDSLTSLRSTWPLTITGLSSLNRKREFAGTEIASRRNVRNLAVFSSAAETPSPEDKGGIAEKSDDETTQTPSKTFSDDASIGKSKVDAVTFNLIKAIAGSGVLALPSGLAAMSDYPSSLVPAIALMGILGGISAYTFAMYGRLVHASQAKSLGELWEKKKNKRSAWFVSVASLTFCFGACLSYSILLGDVSSSMAQTIGCSGILISRQFWIILLTTLVLYPLCNLRSLLALAPLSLAGVGAVFMTTLFIVLRCPLVNSGSPYAAAGGKLLKTLTVTQLPKFNTFNNGLCHPSSLILLGMAASAYL